MAAYIQLPDLYVRNVGCDAVLDQVWVGGHIGNAGPIDLPTLASNPSTPQQVDVLTTLNPNSGGQAQKLRLNPLVSPAHGAGDLYYKIAAIPNADPTNLPPTLFQIYVNPPEPGAPFGQFAESNLQNNMNCGVCQCDTQGCRITAQAPNCMVGP